MSVFDSYVPSVDPLDAIAAHIAAAQQGQSQAAATHATAQPIDTGAPQPAGWQSFAAPPVPGLEFAPEATSGPLPSYGDAKAVLNDPSLGPVARNAMFAAALPPLYGMSAAQGLGDAIGSLPALADRAHEEGPFGSGGQYSDDTLGHVAEAVANLGAVSAPIPRPAGSLGIFGGRAAVTADHAAADAAEHALSQGVSDAQVLQSTGWFPGVDGKMRFEIPDHAAVFNGDKTATTVGQALNHPSLFAAYPHLSDIPLSFGEMASGQLGYNSGDSLAINSSLNHDDTRSTLLHELQHSVQDRENFARGGNAENEGIGAGKDERMSAYRGLAGEVEARNVQARRDMQNPPAPWETQDTPYINQNPHFSITNGMASAAVPPRLLDNAPLTAAQVREHIFGGLQPGAPAIAGIDGTGFFYPQYPNVMANEAFVEARPKRTAFSSPLNGMFGSRRR